MRKKNYRIFVAALLILCFLLSGCASKKSKGQAADLGKNESDIHTPEPTAVVTALPTPEITATPAPTPTPEPTPTPIPTVEFKNASVPIDSYEIRLVLDAGESELLDDLPNLSVCHLEGSTCYDEIIEYIASHPNVSVSYDVNIFGTAYTQDTNAILFSGSYWNTDTVLNAFRWLPELETIDLNGKPLSVNDCELLSDFLGSSIVNYKISIGNTSFESEIESIEFKQLDSETINDLTAVLPYLPNLTLIDLSKIKNVSLEDIGKIQQLKTGLVVDYPITIYGKTFSTADKYIVLSKKKIKVNQLNDLRKIVPYMTNCEKVIMENCGLSDEVMDELRTELEPYTEVVWRIKCGPYSCRTDAIMIKFAGKSTVLDDKKAKSLKYCHDVVYLDLGHNHLQHIDFVAEMPNLEVCIIAVNYLKDISPIKNCTKLEYCEFLSNIKIDVTPLAACTELKHLNISYSKVSDITPLYGLTKLERLWISRNPIPEEQIATIKELLPNTIINTTTHNCTGEGWREHPRYDLLKEQFRYDNSHIRSYYILDGKIVEDETK